MSNITAYIILIVAVFLGTASNGFAKSAEGFTILIPSVLTAITIVGCMYALSQVMKVVYVLLQLQLLELLNLTKYQTSTL